jgi:hypothetical protein
MKNTITRRHLAVLNDQSLQATNTSNAGKATPSLQRQRISRQGALSSLPPGVYLGVPAVEITVGVPASELLRQAIAKLRQPELHAFLSAVVAEPEVALALSTAISPKGVSRSLPTYPVQSLRRAAELASFWCGFGPDEREVLYAATFIQGLRHLLADVVLGAASLDDILFTLVRPHLHRLDQRAARHASLLRLALGWGNADEVDAHYVPRLQEAVARALRCVRLDSSQRPNASLC